MKHHLRSNILWRKRIILWDTRQPLNKRPSYALVFLKGRTQLSVSVTYLLNLCFMCSQNVTLSLKVIAYRKVNSFLRKYNRNSTELYSVTITMNFWAPHVQVLQKKRRVIILSYMIYPNHQEVVELKYTREAEKKKNTLTLKLMLVTTCYDFPPQL